MNIDEYRALKAQEDSRESESDQPESENTQQDSAEPQTSQEQEAETTQESTQETTATNQEEAPPETPVTPEKIVIDGEEVTLEDLREWRKSGLRTADYTRKTQELARKNKELEQAAQLFEFFKANPQAAKAALEAVPQSNGVLKNVDPFQQKVQELEQRYYDLMLEREIETLQSKYSDFEVREVLEIAQREGLTNLEAAYKISIADKKQPSPEVPSSPTTPTVDVDALRNQIRAELMKELDSERRSTTSIISSNDSAPPPQNESPTLSPEEDKVRRNMGISLEEWMKWRQ